MNGERAGTLARPEAATSGAQGSERRAKLAALRWDDVDLEHGVIHVHRAMDCVRTRGKLKPTKTNLARRFPIEPELRPLLEAMRSESGGRGALIAMPSPGMLSRKLRVCLDRAASGRPSPPLPADLMGPARVSGE